MTEREALRRANATRDCQERVSEAWNFVKDCAVVALNIAHPDNGWRHLDRDEMHFAIASLMLYGYTIAEVTRAERAGTPVKTGEP